MLVIRRLKQEIRDLNEEVRLLKEKNGEEHREALTPDEVGRLQKQVRGRGRITSWAGHVYWGLEPVAKRRVPAALFLGVWWEERGRKAQAGVQAMSLSCGLMNLVCVSKSIPVPPPSPICTDTDAVPCLCPLALPDRGLLLRHVLRGGAQPGRQHALHPRRV